MFEAIKSLSVQQRLFAFVFAVLISSAASIATVYLKTDDCKEISNQYTEVIKNQADLMTVNTVILNKYNVARQDLLIIQEQLERLQDLMKNDRITSKIETPRYENMAIIEHSDTVGVMSAMAIQPERIITTIERVPSSVMTSIDSILTITHKYQDQRSILPKEDEE
jgi:hypothetical protein